jgi:hypothetical protein
MNKAQGLTAHVVDVNEILTHTSKNPFTGEVDTWGGNLLAPDEEGYPRRHRLVYILGGFDVQAYGGPEEGGWYYDHFTETFRIETFVGTEDMLVDILKKVDELLTLTLGDIRTVIRIGVEDWPHFGRPHYE